MGQSPAVKLLRASFLACLSHILELEPARLPCPDDDEDPAGGWTVSRWLGGLGMGIARLADPQAFSWPGPWIARVRPGESATELAQTRFVVMFGVPSGVVWDPAGDGRVENEWIEQGYLLAAADIAQARPPLPTAPSGSGAVEGIWIAASAGEPARSLTSVRALAGEGLQGDRHVAGTGTFPSGRPGSALTLVDAAVCESFDPPLQASQHRRNLVVRGLDLNRLVSHEFRVGSALCRGMRLCEPCTVVQRYVGRPVLRALVHRGGLRADILADGEIRVGDSVRALDAPEAC
ncbi:MAG: MOSC domain-containing protein [Solirubrobacteraceae bacterium]